MFKTLLELHTDPANAFVNHWVILGLPSITLKDKIFSHYPLVRRT